MNYETNDLCLGFWSRAWGQGWIDFPHDAQVLEIGCAESDWQTPMLAIRPDLQITGLDWRVCERPGKTIRGNVMDGNLFPPESFDAVVSVSAIEHVGLGFYDEDPVNPDGDTIAMRNAHRWLKPDGWMYLDVPYRPDGAFTVTGTYRAYSDAAVQARLMPGWRVVQWAKCVTDHPDGPYLALLLKKV